MAALLHTTTASPFFHFRSTRPFFSPSHPPSNLTFRSSIPNCSSPSISPVISQRSHPIRLTYLEVISPFQFSFFLCVYHRKGWYFYRGIVGCGIWLGWIFWLILSWWETWILVFHGSMMLQRSLSRISKWVMCVFWRWVRVLSIIGLIWCF